MAQETVLPGSVDEDYTVQEPDLSGNVSEAYDIFLCTRGLPDKLTGETAALRQLCAALIGSGYKVFFAPSMPKDTPPEEMAMAMANAVKTAPVMIAAAVGDEGAQDNTARFLWRQFRESVRNDPSRRFIACSRDLSAQPEEFADAEVLDMGDLEFLVKLKDRLTAVLPAAAKAGAEFIAPEAPRSPEDPESPESPVEEATPVPPAPDDRRRKLWLALAIGAVAIVLLILLLCLR